MKKSRHNNENKNIETVKQDVTLQSSECRDVMTVGLDVGLKPCWLKMKISKFNLLTPSSDSISISSSISSSSSLNSSYKNMIIECSLIDPNLDETSSLVDRDLLVYTNSTLLLDQSKQEVGKEEEEDGTVLLSPMSQPILRLKVYSDKDTQDTCIAYGTLLLDCNDYNFTSLLSPTSTSASTPLITCKLYHHKMKRKDNDIKEQQGQEEEEEEDSLFGEVELNLNWIYGDGALKQHLSSTQNNNNSIRKDVNKNFSDDSDSESDSDIEGVDFNKTDRNNNRTINNNNNNKKNKKKSIEKLNVSQEVHIGGKGLVLKTNELDLA
eukprot:CAMPEP_0114385260 /NCGR_PEP_ID=MMETSP0102-20121206/5878_1 /TAXON_ID=38822 ORGANISM="Pteridomonas danica, Strain PT" /NCGR_SAMPLE_ID=MMETSP0102 /ASSEMBLY_ACC=CAM_ASM_000212 /LENGTH=322 /DNA_ID=CAMNT_0001541777 /DNA_START=245 /DNA_END=1209 /DNA_ORIENTATION=+